MSILITDLKEIKEMEEREKNFILYEINFCKSLIKSFIK